MAMIMGTFMMQVMGLAVIVIMGMLVKRQGTLGTQPEQGAVFGGR